MSALLPAAVYGLEVPPGDILIPATPDFPASFRITMAAIDPSAEPEHDGPTEEDAPIRATLKLVRLPISPDDDESDFDSDEEDNLEALLNGADSDEYSSDDEEKNGGPSDLSKSKKAIKEAAIEKLKQALAENDDDGDMDVDEANGINGAISKLNKGKGKATGEEESDDDDSEDLDLEELVICTLDPKLHYQQALDLTIGEDERVFFKVSGTHAIYLTGNYVIPVGDDKSDYGEDEEDEYDLSPDEDELDLDDEEDELDALEDPRITEVDSDDQEVPKLVKTGKDSKKGKNKRAAEESDEDDKPTNLDDLMAAALKPQPTPTNGDAKLSKKQLKKLKNNAGEAVATSAENKNVKKVESSTTTESPNSKKVQFAKNLEQGPTGTELKAESKSKGADKKASNADDKPKATLGVKTVNGVKIDDKKLGTGPAAKKGDKVGMRYIGKLADGKVFDSNKKGKPFSFKLGAGEVIKGWDIGVAGMSMGGERRIHVPAHLAYGSKGMPGIPPNSPLTFDVKLVEIY